MAINRYHSVGEVPGSVKMLPISLPELPKPSRTLGKSQKPILEPEKLYKNYKNKPYIPYIFLLKGPIKGGMLLYRLPNVRRPGRTSR